MWRKRRKRTRHHCLEGAAPVPHKRSAWAQPPACSNGCPVPLRWVALQPARCHAHKGSITTRQVSNSTASAG